MMIDPIHFEDPIAIRKLISDFSISFFDFGCSHGGSVIWVQNKLKAIGLGFDIDLEKIKLASSKDVFCCNFDILKLPDEKFIPYTTIFHMLEHLNNVTEAKEHINKACIISKDSVYIKQPFFDSDPLLFKDGFKTFYSHWTGHPNKMTTPDFFFILEDLIHKNIISDYLIGYKLPITNSDSYYIHPLDSPIDSKYYDPNKHPPKNSDVSFAYPLFYEIMIAIDINGNGFGELWEKLAADCIAYSSQRCKKKLNAKSDTNEQPKPGSKKFSNNKNKKFIEVILHIGDGKCGSTSLQSSLFENADHLLKNGILYHAPARRSGHFSWVTLLNVKTRGDDIRQKNIAKNNIREINQLILKANVKFLLLSGESFFSLKLGQLFELLKMINANISYIHVLGFVRCPARMYLSLMQQRIKGSHKIIPPDRYKRNIFTPFFQWTDVPECKTITPKIFDKRFLSNGSIVAEFEEYIKYITGNNINLTESSENESLSAEQMIILQKFRSDFLKNKDGKFCEESNRLIQFFHEINRLCEFPLTNPRLKITAKNSVLQNNIEFIKKIDSTFPEVLMEERCVDSPFLYPDEYHGKWESNCVSSILEGYNPEIVNHLKVLLPRYNPDLKKGLNCEAKKSLSFFCECNSFIVCYSKYLSLEGCYNAKHDLWKTDL